MRQARSAKGPSPSRSGRDQPGAWASSRPKPTAGCDLGSKARALVTFGPWVRRAGISVPVVLIAEMLLLVAVDDKGHVPAGSDAFVKVGLTGALLAELAIDGQLTVGDDGRVRTGDTRPGDELLADVYDAVRNHLEGKKARQVIGGLSRHIGGSRDRVVDRLADAGVLGRDRPSVLRPTRHPIRDTAARQAVLDQVRIAARGEEQPVRPDVGVVLALAGPCRLLERVAPDRGTRGEAKKQIARATAEAPFAPGVAKIINELIAAVAVTAATAAS